MHDGTPEGSLLSPVLGLICIGESLRIARPDANPELRGVADAAGGPQ